MSSNCVYTSVMSWYHCHRILLRTYKVTLARILFVVSWSYVVRLCTGVMSICLGISFVTKFIWELTRWRLQAFYLWCLGFMSPGCVLTSCLYVLVWQGFRSMTRFCSKIGWKWKWSDKCRKSEISLIWCISTTNNMKSCKKFNETAQTANFTDFSLTSCGNGP